MARSLVVVCVVFVLLGSPVAGETAFVQSVDADTVLMDVALQPDGDAEWEIDYRIRLDNDNDTDAFESLADDIEQNESEYTGPFAERMRSAARSAENVTGRNMTIRNVTVETSRDTVGQEYGVVTYRFEWTNFAATDGSTVRMDGALEGLFLDSSTTLRIEWPASYGLVESPSPSPDEQTNNSAVWEGTHEFDDGEPALAVAPTTTTTAAATGPTATATTTAAGDAGGGGLPGWLWLVVVGLLLGVVVALARSGALEGLVGDGSDGDAPAGTAATADDQQTDPDAGDRGDDAADDGPPPELLSNEERVLRLLERNGGRMKQQDIVAELDWTDAKTSQVIGDLREDGKVETFRIGRENVVTLPEESLN